MDALRLRRNYVEHPSRPSKVCSLIENEHRLRDIASLEPEAKDDWNGLQVGLLQRLCRALEIQTEQINSALDRDN